MTTEERRIRIEALEKVRDHLYDQILELKMQQAKEENDFVKVA